MAAYYTFFINLVVVALVAMLSGQVGDRCGWSKTGLFHEPLGSLSADMTNFGMTKDFFD